jgi:cell division septal protein FtsQ
VLGLGRSSTLPLIRGASERGLGPGSVIREKNVLDALDVLDLCDATRLGSVIHVDVIEAASPDRLVLRLSGGEVIPMGRDQLKERLEKLVDVLKTAQEMGQAIQTADLTVLRNVPVVYRKP